MLELTHRTATARSNFCAAVNIWPCSDFPSLVLCQRLLLFTLKGQVEICLFLSAVEGDASCSIFMLTSSRSPKSRVKFAFRLLKVAT
ncbi:protein of unknown function [Methylorubrum extorquens]|uniref:Uncharacterized protein n=1 Tax=Methylorubrum extorquens TaxID=408 RepID=A0A2N9ATH8_METEX|nr:protein of unknown function [Methylorubrum extorquens]